MIETVICICGLVAFGGIANLCCSEAQYAEDYYQRVRHNKKVQKSTLPKEIDFYRFF